ncbi:hypothetical protein [Campylobacter rectus]
MNKILKFTLCGFAWAILVTGATFASDTSASINTASYNALLKEYLNGAGSGMDFEAHNFEKYANDLQIYCQKGVPYACAELAYLYWFGVGVVKDEGRSRSYFNTLDKFDKKKDIESIKIVSDNIKYILLDTEAYKNYNDEEILNYIKAEHLAFFMDCVFVEKRSADRDDVCLVAFSLQKILPADMLYTYEIFGDKRMDKDALTKMLLKAEARRNGLVNSKLFGMLRDMYLPVGGFKNGFFKDLFGDDTLNLSQTQEKRQNLER